MKEKNQQQDLETESFELNESPELINGMNRRRFVQLFSGGLAVAVVYGNSAFLEADFTGSITDKLPIEKIGAWLHITEQGKVIVYTGKVEVGQNIRTSLAQAVAEELRLPIESIEMVMGDTDKTPYDRGTYGSLTTPQMSPILRQAAVGARSMLLNLAAEKWQTNRSSLIVAGGKITDPRKNRSLSFGELTKGQQLMDAIGTEDLTPATEWKVSGTSIHKVNGRSFVTGTHKYTSDMRLEGLLYGKVLRPPAFGAKLIGVDLSEAKTIPGVTVVEDGQFIGVTAPDLLTASRALAAIKADWETTDQVSQDNLFEHLKNTSSSSNRAPHIMGSVQEAFTSAEVISEDLYTAQYIAHVPLEPRAALAQWTDEKLTVWTGTQRPFGVHSELKQAFKLEDDKVRVLVPDTGSGYGGKHSGEAAIEAAQLAKAAEKPVKLVWTREEEFTWAYARPAARIEVKSAVNKSGELTAWEFHTYNAGRSAINTFYEIPNQHIKSSASDSPIRQGSYRALASTVNVFARESQMDVMAHQANMDPLEFRLKHLQDQRMMDLLKACADKFGWGKTKPAPGTGYGIACGIAKNGYLVNCVEVSIDRDSGLVKVVRIVTAFDCGAIVNPVHLKAQIEGCIIQGLGGALFESIEFGSGTIYNPNFSSYRVPRFSDIPELEIVLMDRKDLPSAGAGEAPIIGIAPAIANAIFNATGKRLRSLPLVPNGLEL